MHTYMLPCFIQLDASDHVYICQLNLNFYSLADCVDPRSPNILNPQYANGENTVTAEKERKSKKYISVTLLK